MRPYTDYYEDPDEIEEFAYAKSQALQKLLEGLRREERHQTHHRGFQKKRYQREPWDADYNDDWDSYLDDSSADVFDQLIGRY